MADFSNVQQSSDVKVLFSRLRELCENKRQMFLNKQLIEHKNLFEQSRFRKLEQQINQDHLSESCLGTIIKDGKLSAETGDRNLSESNSTLQESSVTGHILHCFSDSSFGSSTPDRNQDGVTTANDIPSDEANFSSCTLLTNNEDSSASAVALPLKRPKQQFLRKRSGLLRYFPKQKVNVTKTKKPAPVQNSESEHCAKPILKLNPAFKINKSPQKINHVKFIEHELCIPNKASDNAEELDNTSESCLVVNGEKCVDTGGSEEGCNTLENGNLNDEKICTESLNMEKKELAVFELLEDCAQNSSFNSDSSIVQRVLHGESIQPLQWNRKPSPPVTGYDFDHSEKVIMHESPVNSENLNFGDFLEEQRKQRLQDIILDTDLRIESLKKETSKLNKDAYNEENGIHERCSTPVDEVKDRFSPIIPDSTSSSDSSSSSVICNPVTNYNNCVKMLNSASKSGMHNSEANGSYANTFQNNQHSISKKLDIEDDASEVKTKLCQKMQDLENEIKTYQQLNSEMQKEKQTYQEHNMHLASIRTERDDNLKKLQKGWDELQKHKEEEEKKLEDKRRQLKMREETFNRYQKLRRDNPSRKEREELTVLRQEVEKLQEELKRQRIKLTNENKRLKNQLIAAEQERDCLKLENITLDEQCQDLLATLKSRHIKKKPEAGKKIAVKKKSTPASANHLNNKPQASSEITTNGVQDSESNDKAENNSKPRVRFNLVPQFDNEEFLQSTLQIDHRDENIIPGTICESSNETPAIKESNKEELPFEEITYNNQIERVYFTGEKEIIRPSGIIMQISADGNTVTYRYPNGDIKEVYPDSSVICKFISGVIEKRFPGGIEVTEHPNGQIEKRSPGREEVKFPDGTTQIRYIFPDGSEKIEYNDGTKVTVEPDGTEIALFKNGVKEIRTVKYKRKEYPDGSVKIIYEDGSQETRYSNGRVKKKDKNGRILLDTKILQNEFRLSY